MGKFKKIETSIEGVYVIEPTVFGENERRTLCAVDQSSGKKFL